MILVNPGIYRETVTVPASGDSLQPFTFRASGTGVVVDGSDDFSGASLWALSSGTVYLGAGVTWSPLQVFVDGQRLAPSAAGPTALPPNTFQYVAGTGLYVNLGGDNPGVHQTAVGRRLYGFRLTNVNWVEVDGFAVGLTEDKAVYLSGTTGCSVRNNVVTQSRKYGIHVAGGASNLIEKNRVYDNQFHGIGLLSGATGTTVQDNESYGNADPAVRVANGLYVSGASGNLIRRNRWHDNQDSGEQFIAVSDNNLSIENLSWNNGDRGFDRLDSRNSVMIGCVSYGNATDGVALDGTSTGGQMYDCIVTDNGITTGRFDLFVSATAVTGLQSDDNILWNSTSQAPVRFNSATYATIAAFRAVSGTDTRTLQSDPRFAGAAGGDFHLLAGSPAIDDANSGLSAWPATDAEGRGRADDPLSPNAGLGPVAFADRGAYEYQPPPNQAPNGTIDSPASDVTIFAGQSVSFAASGADPDHNLPLSFAWSFGGGAPGTVAEDPGTVIFDTPGTYAVALTVTDARGLADPTPATRTVTVAHAPAGVPDDEIHWTFTGATSVTLDWRGFDSSVRYGPTPAYGSIANGAVPSPLPFSSPGPFREAKISGLQVNTVYHYSIGSGPDHTFHTPPPRGASGFTLFAAGDIGSSHDFPAVAPLQAVIAAEHPALVLMMGDLTYGDSTSQSSVDQHFNDVMVWSQDAAYMPAWGDHDWSTPDRDDLRNDRGRFDLPHPKLSPGSPAAGGEDWSWFDYGNVRFISYPEPYDATSWPDWGAKAAVLMDEAQVDPQIRFIVTFGHRPAYSSAYPGGEAIRTQLDALGSSHSKYVLNLNGHSHDYERSLPQAGVVHVTSGTGGSALEPAAGPCIWGACPPPPWSAFRAMHHVSLRLEFYSAGILGEALCGPSDPANDITCAAGTVVDSFVIGTLHQGPIVSAPPTARVDEGGALTLSVSATDPDGYPIASLTATGLPAGATFTPGAGNTSGTLTWAPTYLQAGTYNVTFTAANSLSRSASTAIIVRNVDRAPVVTAPATAAGEEASPIVIAVTASDPDSESISSLTASALPAGATFTANPSHTSGSLTWTPSAGQQGVYILTFTAANALTGTSTTTLSVRASGAPIVTAPAAVTALAGSPLTVEVSAHDPDQEPITHLTASGLPAGASFTTAPDNATGSLSWTPTAAQAGAHDVTFTAENSLSTSATTRITVTAADRAPTVTAPPSATVQAGTTLTLDVAAADPDGGAIASFTASQLPGAAFAARNGNALGTLTWTPAAADAGNHAVTFTATNALSGSASTTVKVLPANLTPIPVVALSTAIGSAPLSVTVDASASEDLDGTIRMYRFDFGDGVTTPMWPPGITTHKYAAYGNWTLAVTVTDNQGATATRTIPVTVSWEPDIDNLVDNPSFETGTDHWGPYSTTVLQRVAGGFDGAWALKLTGPSSLGGFGLNDSPNWVTAVPAAGKRYRVSACVRSDTDHGTAKIQVREYAGVAKVGEVLSQGVALTQAWRMVTADYVSIGQGTSLDVQVIDFPLAPGEVFLVDNVSIYDMSDPGLVGVPPDAAARAPLVATVAPSPMRTSSTIAFVTSRPGPLRVTLFDLSGRQVRTLLEEPRAAAGFHVATVDGRDDRGKKLASGLYFFRIQALEGRSSGRLVIAR